MIQGQIVWRGETTRPTYADHWSGLNDEQRLMLSNLGVGWIPNCPVFLGESRLDDIDPEMTVPLAHGPWKLGVYLPSMQPTDEDIHNLITRCWTVCNVGEDCLKRWRVRPDLFQNEFVFGSLAAQKAATRVRWKHWLTIIQEIT